MPVIKKSNYIPFSAVFVSPHLDDAVLSATQALLHELARPKARVLCLTIFTGVDPLHHSTDALKFCRDAGFSDPVGLFKQRCQEDKFVMQKLGCEWQHWSYSDAGFRQNLTTSKPLYATYDQIFRGQISIQDQSLISKLTTQLSHLAATHTAKTTRWYAPLGVGNHVDHLLTYSAILQLLMTKKISAKNVHFWLDVPYHHNPAAFFARLANISTQTIGAINPPQPQIQLQAWKNHWLSSAESALKQALIRKYTSQWPGLVKTGGYDSLDDHYERSMQLLLP